MMNRIATYITSMNRQTLGIVLLVCAIVVFASQDGISKYLADKYNSAFIMMIRYWAFAVFVVMMSARAKGGIRQIARTQVPVAQFARGTILALEACVVIWSFARLGLAATHAIFAAFPLVVIALSVPLLGEKVGWHRWGAVLAGFIGVLIIVQPGSAVFSPIALLAVLGTVMFAGYNILTRWVARYDSAETSFFWTGIGGAVTLSFVGPFFWDPMQNAHDWAWMLVLCATAVVGHYLLIKALALAEASSLQPYFFLLPVLASLIGVFFFDEIITWPMLLGASIIIAAGMYSFWRERVNG